MEEFDFEELVKRAKEYRNLHFSEFLDKYSKIHTTSFEDKVDSLYPKEKSYLLTVYIKPENIEYYQKVPLETRLFSLVVSGEKGHKLVKDYADNFKSNVSNSSFFDVHIQTVSVYETC